ncbi:PREDICTED: TNF receptor-associated factor 4-like [Priapulus caudatus]|uniref:TNF receptor-associated factor 4-like n=1 Tax=Priapulus caudatus TaxID=37621 RepID=A0ABM1E8H7_PRICU|nr:PREDICTED: TNF receptor-associated factor 4-like [Priapulus caudatus]
METCIFAKVCCPNECGETMWRLMLTDHVKLTCSRRSITCKFCARIIIFLDEPKHHLVECPYFPITCTACGQQKIRRLNLSSHQDKISGDCPETFVPCRFMNIGCTFYHLQRVTFRNDD